MTWIRNPWWDGFWFLSAPALGLLMLVPLAVRLPTANITIGLLCINFGHALSPIALAWTHRGYRRVMLARPHKFMGVPALVIITAVVAAMGTWVLFPTFRPAGMVLENLQLKNLTIPIVVWANLYAIWNLYHGGAQNFGFLCLYRGKGFKGRTKLLILAACVVVTVLVGHELSRVVGYQAMFLFTFGLITVNHWFAAIGISAHVYARHTNHSPLWFAAGVIAVGGLLVWGFLGAVAVSIHAAIMALCLRGALGIWHFLQDRWIWQLSKPEVKATIGRDLFA